MAAPTLVEAIHGTFSASRSPSLTLASAPLTDDVIVVWPSSGTTATITAPSGWTNILGGTTDVESDAHQMCALWHRVTSGEAGSSTVSWTLTNLYDGTETGNMSVAVVRGAYTGTTPVDSYGTTFSSSNASPHVLAGVTAVHADCLVLSAVAKDITGTHTQPTGWTTQSTNNFTNGKTLLTRDTASTLGETIAATNIAVDVGDEYISITVLIRPPDPTGSGAITQADQTSSGSGTHTSATSGSGTPTQAAQTSSGSGLVTITGSGTPSQAAQTSSGSGTETITGSGTPSQAAQTSSGSGTETITGSGTPTQAAQTSSGSGTHVLTITGSGTPSQAAQTSSGSGTHVLTITGSGTPSQAAQTSSGTGVESFTGSGTPTQADQTSSGSGTLTSVMAGSGAMLQASQTMAGVGVNATPINGSGAMAQADQLVLSGAGSAPRQLTRRRSGYVPPNDPAARRAMFDLIRRIDDLEP